MSGKGKGAQARHDARRVPPFVSRSVLTTIELALRRAGADALASDERADIESALGWVAAARARRNGGL